jgi:hypothetical protein
MGKIVSTIPIVVGLRLRHPCIIPLMDRLDLLRQVLADLVFETVIVQDREVELIERSALRDTQHRLATVHVCGGDRRSHDPAVSMPLQKNPNTRCAEHDRDSATDLAGQQSASGHS